MKKKGSYINLVKAGIDKLNSSRTNSVVVFCLLQFSAFEQVALMACSSSKKLENQKPGLQNEHLCLFDIKGLTL